jgi:hypothetical protein
MSAPHFTPEALYADQTLLAVTDGMGWYHTVRNEFLIVRYTSLLTRPFLFSGAIQACMTDGTSLTSGILRTHSRHPRSEEFTSH